MPTHPIVIVEGPAGSGKSTLVKHLEPLTGLRVVDRSIPVRDPGDKEAVFYSAANDMAKLQVAMAAPQGAIIDRLFFSQWVYGNLRRGNKPPRPNMNALFFHYDTLIEHVALDLAIRSGKTVTAKHIMPRVLLVVLLPPADRIRQYRSQVDRTFRWMPEQELEYYEHIGNVETWFHKLQCFVDIVLYRDNIYGPLVDHVKQFKHQWKAAGADHVPALR